MAGQLFISDLHLTPERPGTVELYLRFLQQQAANAETLYILGDLFDAWIGDDYLVGPVQAICDTMKRCADSGCRIRLMHGNRDFLIGKGFLEASGAELLEDPSVVDIDGVPTLLMHGDLLCSDDTEYQQARHLLRNPAFIADFLSKPVPERIALAAEYRKRSGEVVASKAAEIMDVNDQTVIDFMQTHKVQRLVHGHTHRPARHDIQHNGTTLERIVLPDWSEEASGYLLLDGGRLELVDIPAN